jgi:hypothetical protein
VVCDGWSETLRWSIQGETREYNVQIGVGPESILKIIERLGKLLKEEEKKHPPLHIGNFVCQGTHVAFAKPLSLYLGFERDNLMSVFLPPKANVVVRQSI